MDSTLYRYLGLKLITGSLSNHIISDLVERLCSSQPAFNLWVNNDGSKYYFESVYTKDTDKLSLDGCNFTIKDKFPYSDCETLVIYEKNSLCQ